jgi:hypothetical protein
MPLWTEPLVAVAVGLLAGAHASTWGMYKDAPHEGFTWPKYLRSIVAAGVLAPLVQNLFRLDLHTAAGLVQLFALTYTAERFVHEFYKTFLRREDQSKYFIPMALHVDGVVVDNPALRVVVGLLYLAGIMLIGAAVRVFELLTASGGSAVLSILLVGSAGGWLSAFGGAWKDAPLEGFDLRKFFRSPLLALAYAAALAGLTRNYLVITVAALGLTIATIETYKTFFFPSVPRGKFAGKPVLFPAMLRRRKRFVPLYIAIWLAVLATAVAAFLSPREGLW